MNPRDVRTTSDTRCPWPWPSRKNAFVFKVHADVFKNIHNSSQSIQDMQYMQHIQYIQRARHVRGCVASLATTVSVPAVRYRLCHRYLRCPPRRRHTLSRRYTPTTPRYAASTSFSESIDDDAVDRDNDTETSRSVTGVVSDRALGPHPSRPPSFSDTPLASGSRLLTDGFVSLNMLIFFLQIAFADELHLTDIGVNVHALVDQGEIWRLGTAMFLHGSFMHLLLNNLSLHSLGSVTEWTCGRKRFVLIYLLSGLGGNLASYFMTSGASEEQIASLGASGAIFGLAGALIVYFARNRVLYRDTEVPSGMLSRLILTVIGNFALGSLLPNIDEAGHWGGLLSGMVLALMLGPHYTLVRRAGHLNEVYLVDESILSDNRARLVCLLNEEK